MPYLVILAQDSEPEKDPVADVKRFRRGDVLDVLPNGHKFGRLEKDDPRFRIVKVPGAMSAYADLLATDIGFDTEVDTHPARRSRINLDDLDAKALASRLTEANAGTVQSLRAADIAEFRKSMAAAPVKKSDLVVE